MIDTVVLVFTKGTYITTSPSGLDARRYVKGVGFVVDTYFCSKYANKCKKEGKYFPQIKLQKNKGQEIVEVQVSLPKLLFGSNVFEVKEQDIDFVYERLIEILAEIGIHINANDIENAILKQVDFATNIIFPAYYGSAQFIIRKLGLFNYKRSSEFDNKSYGYTGQGASIGHWNGTQRYSIYDKLEEVVSSGYTKQEKGIIEKFDNRRIPYPIIRFEFSLKTKQSLNAFLRRRLDKQSKGYNLKDIFNQALVQSILTEVYKEVYSNLHVGLINASEMKDNDLIYRLGQMDLGTPKEIKMYYWVNMVTKYGVRQALSLVDKKYSGGNRGTVKTELKEVLSKLPSDHSNTLGLMELIHEKHISMRFIRPDDFSS